MNNNLLKFMIALNQTVSHSNNGYHGSGKINLYQKNLVSGRGNFSHAFSRSNPVKLIKYINPWIENWFTVNSVTTSNRHSAKVSGFNMMFCDIDSEGLADEDPIKTYYQVLDMIHAHKILTPTSINYSGHGIHLIYMFKHQIPNYNDKIKRYWEKTEIANLKMISKHIKGVDWKVRDCNRILRMPYSNNTKDFAKTHDKDNRKLVRIMKFTGVKYDFWTLCEELVEKPEHAERVARYNKWKRDSEYRNSLNTQKRLKVFDHSALSYKSINLAHRIKSVIKLIDLRHGRMDHYRNTVLHIIGSGWLYVNHNAKFVSKDTQKEIKLYTWHLVKKVNQKFEVPKRKEVMLRFRRRILASNFDINKKHNDFGKYCYSRKGMIRVLDIKPCEQWYLKYLRTPKVEREHLAYTRKLDRYNQKSAEHVADYQKKVQEVDKRVKQVHKMMKMRKHQYTYKQIAKTFNRSVSYIYKLIKSYQYLAKYYGTHKYNICMNEMNRIESTKAETEYVPNVLQETLKVMTRIRGSA